MSRIHWIAILLLTACSSKESGSAPGDVLVKGTVSSTSGAMIFHDADPAFVLSIPPSAVAQDVELTISTSTQSPGVDAISPVIDIAPDTTALSFPATLSITVKSPAPGLVLARVTDSGLERVPGSTVDATTQ